MQIDITKIKPNPFRDFDLYPIDPDQVTRLRRSIHDLGFFAGIAVRPDPEQPGFYQMAMGHHRIEAARAEGITKIEATVERYDDADMVAIMFRENLTQRGANAAAALDSVASQARLTAYAVLVSEDFGASGPHVAKILATSGILNQKSLDTAKGMIVPDGPGRDLIYRAFNGFDKEERQRIDPETGEKFKAVETITSSDIDAALAGLKKSGHMAKIMQQAHTSAEFVRRRREAEAAKAAEVEAAKQKALEEARQQEAKLRAEAIERQKAAEEEAKRKADAARKAAVRADADAKEAAERKAAETKAAAEKAAATRKASETAAKAQAAADAKARKQAKAEREAKQKEADAEAARRKAEAEAIEAQAKLAGVYDIRCVNVFRLPTHENAFRQGVLSVNGLRFIPKEQQLPMAQKIRAEIDAVEKKRGVDLGGVTVKDFVNEVLAEAMKIQRNMEWREKEQLLRESTAERVKGRWKTVGAGLMQAEAALKKLGEEREAWERDYPDHMFPVDLEVLAKLRGISARMDAVSKVVVGPMS